VHKIQNRDRRNRGKNKYIVLWQIRLRKQYCYYSLVPIMPAEKKQTEGLSNTGKLKSLQIKSFHHKQRKQHTKVVKMLHNCDEECMLLQLLEN